MRKVMLVIDGVSEMVGLEAFLRRLGFDVLSLGKESQVNDALLGFQPEVVIASFRGRNVDGPRLALRLKKSVVPQPRIALAYSGASPQMSDEAKKSIEALIEIPVEATSAIRMMAQLSGLDLQPMLEKYEKVSTAVLTKDEQIVIITGKVSKPAKAQLKPNVDAWDPGTMRGQAATARTERSNRYDQFLEDNEGEKIDKVLPHDKAAKAMLKLKADSASDQEVLERIQKAKLEFAKALFEAGKEKK